MQKYRNGIGFGNSSNLWSQYSWFSAGLQVFFKIGENSPEINVIMHKKATAAS